MRGQVSSKIQRQADRPISLIAHLLPNYDEYVVAYTDRSAIFDPTLAHRLHLRGGVLNNVVVIDGLVSGGWKRELKKQGVLVTVEPLWTLSPEEEQAVEQAARRYGDFLGLPVTLNIYCVGCLSGKPLKQPTQ